MADFLKKTDIYFVELGNNEYVSPALTLLLILYAALIAPKLSEKMARLFDVPLFNLLLFFLIAYTARNNPTAAIIATIGVLVSMMTLNNYKVDRKMLAAMAVKPLMSSPNEEFEAMDAEEVELAQVEQDQAQAQAQDQEVVSEMDMPLSVGQDIEIAALVELQADGGVSDTCNKRADFRNSFWPQYVENDFSTSRARFSDGSVTGFDTAGTYASV